MRIRFRLPRGKKDPDVEARVAWTDRRVGMALPFTTQDAPARSAIDDFVKPHSFSNRKAQG